MTKSSHASQLNVVMVGHVDHGKSTVIGRLLADTGALPQGKLEQVKASCARNAKPFEYAFLLDALKDEQSQGITIDTARSFFKTQKRRYILIDAPGHIEFLKNMITGTARAEAAFIVIDAGEGIKENSKRHGYMVSMLGLQQVSVLINKMDLINYDEKGFNALKEEYSEFLSRFSLKPVSFIPVSARNGINMTTRGSETPWYNGPSVLEQFDAFETADERSDLPFRLPLQDIYKFTEQDDDRRIFAGKVETGSVKAGDSVTFLPSGKQSRVASVEVFNRPPRSEAQAGEATGITLATQIYVKPGELVVKTGDKPPLVSSRFRANLFWMGRNPMVMNRKYKLKMGAARTGLRLVSVANVLDASELTTEANKMQVDRHDVAECIFETAKPVAFDLISGIKYTGRFVVVDNNEIAGAGIVLESVSDGTSTLKEHVAAREFSWKSGRISASERSGEYGHRAKFVVLTGESQPGIEAAGILLEERLFKLHFKSYYLRIRDVIKGLDSDIEPDTSGDDEHIRRLGELARILTDAGQIFITSLSGIDDTDLKTLELLNHPNEILVVNIGENRFSSYPVTMQLPGDIATTDAVKRIADLLREKKIIADFCI